MVKLNELQLAADTVITEEQQAALNSAKESLGTVLAEKSAVITENTATKLSEISETLKSNINMLDDSTMNTVLELNTLLESLDSKQGEFNEELYVLVDDLLVKLTANIAQLNDARADVERALHELIPPFVERQEQLRKALREEIDNSISETTADIQSRYDAVGAEVIKH